MPLIPSTNSPRPARPTSRAREYRHAVGVVLAAALVALPVRALVNTIDVAMWLLLAVVIVAARSSRGPALLASALAIVTFDVMFVPPYYRLTVDDTDYLFSFGVMLAVATLMSGLTTRIRQQAVEAATREHEARARADLNQALTVAESPAAVIEVVRARLSELLGAPGRILPVPPVSEAAAPAWPDDPCCAIPKHGWRPPGRYTTARQPAGAPGTAAKRKRWCCRSAPRKERRRCCFSRPVRSPRARRGYGWPVCCSNRGAWRSTVR